MQIIAFLSLLIIIAGAYSFCGFLKSLKIRKKTLLYGYAISYVILVSGLLIMWQRQASNYGNVSIMINILISLTIVVFLAIFISSSFFLLDDILRPVRWGISSIRHKKINSYPKRSKVSGIIATTLNSLVFVLIMYGTLFGFTNYKVHHIKFKHPDIPAAFDGFKIVQLSDMHLGTFGNVKQVDKGMDIVNKLNPDLIVFTGDLVNNLSTEAQPYINSLKNIDAPYGKFAIMGNHDYATYAGGLNGKEVSTDIQNLKHILSEMGFTMLDNSHEILTLNDDSLVLAGVENWGIAPFPQYGNLDKALSGISNAFIILLSHDPSHWHEKIINYPQPIALTLSGHTHGMQFGIDTKSIKWSPVQYFYKNWAGLYNNANHFLYVNRGFGGIGYPGRIGIRPEITLIELVSD